MTSDPNGGARRQAERRLDPRLTTRLEAVVEDPVHGQLAFTTIGFSRTGSFLKRRHEMVPLPAVGSLIRIEFRWPLDTQMPPVRVEATVVRQTDDGIGVRFEIAA